MSHSRARGFPPGRRCSAARGPILHLFTALAVGATVAVSTPIDALSTGAKVNITAHALSDGGLGLRYVPGGLKVSEVTSPVAKGDGWQEEDQILEVNGVPVATASELAAALTRMDGTAPIVCTVLRSMQMNVDPCKSMTDLAPMTQGITWNSSYTGSTAGGAHSDIELSCGGDGRQRVFYYDVPAGWVMEVGQSSNSFDSVAETRWGGVCPGSHLVTCIDDPDTQRTHIWANDGSSTERLYFLLDAYDDAYGTFTLEWNLRPASATASARSRVRRVRVTRLIEGKLGIKTYSGTVTVSGFDYPEAQDVGWRLGDQIIAVNNEHVDTVASFVRSYTRAEANIATQPIVFTVERDQNAALIPMQQSIPVASTQLEYTIMLDRRANFADTGLEIGEREQNGQVMIVIDGIGDGMALDWNRIHPMDRISPGDQVLTVNGFSSAKAILAECRKPKMLIMTLRRRSSDARHAAFWASEGPDESSSLLNAFLGMVLFVALAFGIFGGFLCYRKTRRRQMFSRREAEEDAVHVDRRMMPRKGSEADRLLHDTAPVPQDPL